MQLKLTILAAVMMVANTASAVSIDLRFTFDGDPALVHKVGVLVDGVPLTSSASVNADNQGVWHVTAHTFFGKKTSIVIFAPDGTVSVPSNIQIYEGCYWDRNKDGLVSLADFGIYREEIATGTASKDELDSFKKAFGQTYTSCPVVPVPHKWQ